MASSPLFYLIDGHAVAYRQYFGLPVSGFTTQAGEPTNATFGFTRILLDIIFKERPKYLAVSFDMGLSGREEVYADYKGTREKMPDDLAIQIERIKQVVQAFNIPILALEGYEADDIIGTAVKQATDVHCRIITGDRDILQLLDDNVTVALPARRSGPDEVYDVARFEEKYTLHPDQLVDLKALMGDSSDNIPGVKGIGEKTATKLLTAYKTLDGIYDHIDEVKGANQRKLQEGRDLAYLSRDLAQIKFDVPIQLDLAACVAHEFDRSQVLDLFRELEFRSFSNRLVEEEKPEQLGLFANEQPAEISVDMADALVETIVVDSKSSLDDLVATLEQAEAIVWDVETTSVDQMAADLVGIALAVDGDRGYYVPLAHEQGEQIAMSVVLDALRPVMTDPSIPKYAHNAVYDLVMLKRYGLDVQPITFDTMIAEWLLNPTSKFLGLKAFAEQYLGVHMTPISDLIGKGKKQKTMDQIPVSKAAPYAAADAAMTFRAAQLLHPKLEEAGLLDLYHLLELPLVPIIGAMEMAGVAIDVPFLSQMSQELAAQLGRIEQEIVDLSGGYGAFNINSPKQLNDVLFGKLNLPVAGLRKTASGYSTDATTLEKLHSDTGHPIVKQILEYRELSKLKGTYVDALPELINDRTGRIHTSFNQTGTTTGRLSSNSPNLQNIPIRTDVGREVRRAFIAPRGRLLLAVDYSQIELRVLAHISQDQTLMEAFAQDQDIHKATAAAVNNIHVDDVTYEQRSFAKRVNFGLIYGMGAFRLARDSDLTLAEANQFIDTYFERLPNVQKYIENTKRQAVEKGYVETLFGRKRFFPALQAGRSNRNAMEADLRAAINMPIQGTAADIMKKAMIDLSNSLAESSVDAVMMLQVHDELVLEVAEDAISEVRDLVVEVMESTVTLDVPLKANAQSGMNWREMQDM